MQMFGFFSKLATKRKSLTLPFRCVRDFRCRLLSAISVNTRKSNWLGTFCELFRIANARASEICSLQNYRQSCEMQSNVNKEKLSTSRANHDLVSQKHFCSCNKRKEILGAGIAQQEKNFTPKSLHRRCKSCCFVVSMILQFERGACSGCSLELAEQVTPTNLLRK